MMKKKKGLIGKIILIVFILIIVVIGLTVYQVYDLVETISSQQSEIEQEISALVNGDCSKISSIETRVIVLESKVNSACKNPIIYLSAKNIKELPANCDNFKELKKQADEGLKIAKEKCDLKVLNNFTEEKINEYLAQVTSANYKYYARMLNLSIENKTEQEAIILIKDYVSKLE